MFDLKRYVKGLKALGYSVTEVKDFVKALATSNGFVKDIEQALAKTELIFKADPARNLSEQINEFIPVTKGYFSVTFIDKELHIVTEKDKGNRRVILHRLVEAKVLERHPKRNGEYRRVDVDSESIEWKTADPRNVLDVKFPFELHRYVKTFPGSIYILAGSKSEGKTAFADNFILLNQSNLELPQPIYLFSSEGVEEEMHERFLNFGIPIDDWTFVPKRRTTDFADAIVRDHINIIDYLEMRGGEYFLIRDEIAKIYDNLGRGFCLICLQKPPGRDLGLGGYASIEKCRLYLSMEKNILTIIDAKNYKGKINPKGWRWRFDLDKSRGTHFNDIEQLEEA